MSKAPDPGSDMAERVRLLGRTALFQRMRAEDLAGLALRARERVMRTGDTLFRRGDRGTTMLVVLVGQVRIVLPSSDGREQVLRLTQPGEVLGELALLDGGGRTADAVAETNGRLLVIERDDLTTALRNDPDFALALMTMICERLRTATWLLESMLFNDATGRLASTLLILSQGVSGRRVDITQGALGERVGAGAGDGQPEIAGMAERRADRHRAGADHGGECRRIAAIRAADGGAGRRPAADLVDMPACDPRHTIQAGGWRL